jgi:hemin uptake protein HemP
MQLTAIMSETEQNKLPRAPSVDESRRVIKAVRMRVSDLLADSREAILEHNGQEYRLRITASGKLLLTK